METDLKTLIEESLPSLDSSSSHYYICKVPQHIRNENEKAYRPLVMSIGPIHYGDPALQPMQKLKRKFLKCFLQDEYNSYQNNLEYFIRFVRVRVSEIRECYEDKIIGLSDGTVIEMILLDAAFIIYSTVCHAHAHQVLPRELQAFYEFSKKDLFQIENQIPFFIIQDLYDTSFASRLPDVCLPNAICRRFMYLTYFFRSPAATENICTNMKFENPKSIKHLVHLYWECCLHGLKPRDPPRQLRESGTSDVSNINCSIFEGLGVQIVSRSKEHIKRICCLQSSNLSDPQSEFPRVYSLSLQELKASGVKIVVNQSLNVLDIVCDKGVLKIPPILIDDFSEPLFRSILYFEQCHSMDNTYIVDYLIFLDYLIDTGEDVRILAENGILQNNALGSDEAVADLINKVTKYNFIDFNKYNYLNVRKDLEAYAKRRWNKWKAILSKQYFNHPWTVISLIGAVILFVLTLIQTVNSFKN